MTVYQLPKENLFPHPALADKNGLLAVGGDLNPGRLLLAYANGIFPWYSQGYPILWWSPDPRCVLFPAEFKTSKSLRQSIRREKYSFRVNTAFDEVIEACASAQDRSDLPGWLTEEMKDAYKHLYRLGYVWSVETWADDQLAGGLYGVKIGSLFCGESMFYHRRDASKAALKFLCENAGNLEIEVIDVQECTQHLLSLGARNMERVAFLNMLELMMNSEK